MIKERDPVRRLIVAASKSSDPRLRLLATAARTYAVQRDEVTEWLQGGETGISSEYLCAALCGLPLPRYGRPHDAGDFGRCVRLLDQIPRLRANLAVMKTGHGTAWRLLAEHWEELEMLYRREDSDPDYQCTWKYVRRKAIRVPGRKEPTFCRRLDALLDHTLREDGMTKISPGVLFGIRAGEAER